MSDGWWLAILMGAVLTIILVTAWEVMDLLISKFDKRDEP